MRRDAEVDVSLLHRLRLYALRYLAWRLLRAAGRREREARRVTCEDEEIVARLRELTNEDPEEIRFTRRWRKT